MKIALSAFFGLLLWSVASPLMAQTMNEAGRTDGSAPIDDVVEKRTIREKRVLPYDNLREADIFWEKTIWRVIDVREKMNLPFVYPERPFFTILLEAARSGEITVYSQETDKFDRPMAPEEVASIGASIDTVLVMDPETYEEVVQVVRNEINFEDVKRFRIKEKWFFDRETSTLQVRILGIAPLYDERDASTGEFKYERNLFWVYYPHAREVLARERVFNTGNDASQMTWEDLLEMRFFSSYIFKESNVFDRRLAEYLSGVDLLMEGERIKNEIFNFEHDLWSY